MSAFREASVVTEKTQQNSAGWDNTFDSAAVLRVVEVPRRVPNYWAEKGKKLIDEKYAELNGINELCSVVGISTAHFRDVFYAAFGETPKCYLTKMKINRAKEILSDRGIRICEVAITAGFKHRTVFEKAFRRVVGIAPSEYRAILSTCEVDTRK